MGLGIEEVSFIQVLTDLRKGEHNGFYRHAGPNGPEEKPLASQMYLSFRA